MYTPETEANTQRDFTSLESKSNSPSDKSNSSLDFIEKSILNSIYDEKVDYDSKLSKLYKAYNDYPDLLENRRQAIHCAFKLIFMYNIEDKLKIESKSPLVEQKDELLNNKKHLKDKLQRHDDKKEVMAPDIYKDAMNYYNKIKKKLKEIMDTERSINAKLNYKISFYTLFRAVRLYELWTHRLIFMVKEEDKQNNLKQMVKP